MDIYKKDGTLKVAYTKLYDSLKIDAKYFKSTRYHLKCWTRSRGHNNLVDSDYRRMIDLCQVLGLKYATGNDAPRGGVEGDYIEVNFDGRNKFVKEARKDVR